MKKMCVKLVHVLESRRIPGNSSLVNKLLYIIKTLTTLGFSRAGRNLVKK